MRHARDSSSRGAAAQFGIPTELFVGALILFAAAVGCEKSRDSSAGATSEGEQEQSGNDEGKRPASEKKAGESPGESATDAPSDEAPWRRVEKGDLTEAERNRLERARAARKSLASTLKEELQGAVSEESFSGAVEFCRDRAPEIAQSVAEKKDVAIGRTSHRLRNPDNEPPEWATEAVERKEAETYVFRGPEREVGYLRPIKLKGLRVNCHGAEEELAPGVSEALAEHYPEDRATGFKVGDLRGWFWVEVPPGDS